MKIGKLIIYSEEDFCAVVVGEDSAVGPLFDKVRFLALFSVLYTKRWLVFKCDIKFIMFTALVFTFFLLFKAVEIPFL